jgi:2-keto-4-pentenoate hydratase/2-oxohepta-3-ene-1,7-dioic acid hydratase in catechol pathway
MKLGRFDHDRLGVVQADEVLDVTPALAEIPPQHWPLRQGDPLIAHLDKVLSAVAALVPSAPRKPLAQVRLLAPVPNPSKIIGAPFNYRDHAEETKRDQALAHGREIRTIDAWGLFLKANSSLIGFGEEIQLRFADRRNDHEVELAAIIGQAGTRIPREQALAYVCAYAIALDMTVRGSEMPCFRKSIDTYSVLGPWLVTADEIADPNALDLRLAVNGALRQDSNTRHLIYNVQRLVECASSMYTLHPGDIIMTGTPSGVGPVRPGDVLSAYVQHIGSAEIRIADAYAG